MSGIVPSILHSLIPFSSYKASSGRELSHFRDDEIGFHRGEVTCVHTHRTNGGTRKNLDAGLPKLQSQTVTASPSV